jgi:hypothetical protein
MAKLNELIVDVSIIGVVRTAIISLGLGLVGIDVSRMAFNVITSSNAIIEQRILSSSAKLNASIAVGS